MRTLKLYIEKSRKTSLKGHVINAPENYSATRSHMSPCVSGISIYLICELRMLSHVPVYYKDQAEITLWINLNHTTMNTCDNPNKPPDLYDIHAHQATCTLDMGMLYY